MNDFFWRYLRFRETWKSSRFLNKINYGDEAHLYLYGFVERQNSHMRSENQAEVMGIKAFRPRELTV